MTTIFHTTSELLTSILESVQTGKTQLPDFQRNWVWDNERVRRLLASILQSYPIGAVMLLQTGNDNVNFKPREVEGVFLDNNVEPERLVLDGQQRITSLYQALYSGKPVLTRDSRGNSIQRWYYLDIEKCIDPNADKEEAIVSVPEDGLVRGKGNKVVADYSSLEKMCEAGMLPVHLLFWPSELLEWQNKYFEDHVQLPERSASWAKLMSQVHTGSSMPGV